MISDPGKYEKRIDEYMQKLGIKDETKKHIKKAIVQYKFVNGEAIKDIFICDGHGAGKDTDPVSIWFFTDNVASELRGLGSDVTISLINYNGVNFAKIDARSFDWLVASTNSVVEMVLSCGHGVGEFKLVAHGYNCSSLLYVFRKYFSKFLAPGDGSVTNVD